MEICFVLRETLNAVWQEKIDEIAGSDVIVFGFNGLGLVSYKKELSGETEYFHDVAKLSKQLSSVIVCGCDTDNYGVFRHSCVIADKGKLLGVSDMTHVIDQSEFSAGGNLRVYDTSAGKLGIIVCEDVFFPETVRVLALCDADILICVYKKLENSIPQLMIKAGAFSNGLPIALCANNYVAVSDIKGEIKISGSKNIIKTKIKLEKDFHLISSRRRGLYKDFNSGY